MASVGTQRANLPEPSADELSVAMATTPAELAEGMAFCARKYQATYNTQWRVSPDLLFVARRGGRVVGTAGLDLGSNHAEISAERYYQLTPGMRSFIAQNRSRLVEFGRFSADDADASGIVLHAAMSYCQEKGIEFLIAWSNPRVYRHVFERCGVKVCVIDVPVDEQAVHADEAWATPPTGFFLRDPAPHLLVAIVPFLEPAVTVLGRKYERPADGVKRTPLTVVRP
jgi:hypothetical protein